MKWVGGWTCNSAWAYSKTAFEVRVPYMRNVYIHKISVCPISNEIIISGDLQKKYNIPIEYNGTDCRKTTSRPTGDGNTSE